MVTKLKTALRGRRAKITGLVVLFILISISLAVAAAYHLPGPFRSKPNPQPVPVQAAGRASLADGTNTPVHTTTNTAHLSVPAVDPSPQLATPIPTTSAGIPAALVDTCPQLQQTSGQSYQTGLNQTEATYNGKINNLLPGLVNSLVNAGTINSLVTQFNSDVDQLYNYYVSTLTVHHCMPLLPAPAHKTPVS